MEEHDIPEEEEHEPSHEEVDEVPAAIEEAELPQFKQSVLEQLQEKLSHMPEGFPALAEEKSDN